MNAVTTSRLALEVLAEMVRDKGDTLTHEQGMSVAGSYVFSYVGDYPLREMVVIGEPAESAMGNVLQPGEDGWAGMNVEAYSVLYICDKIIFLVDVPCGGSAWLAKNASIHYLYR